MSKINTIIVDDEKKAREGIQILLKDDNDIEIKGIAKDGIEAIEMINTIKPDLIFLDIQMPGINGFEVLNSVDVSPSPQFIFVTAYDEYALKAFEVHALDYLLKPFSDERFYAALDKAKNQIQIDKKSHLDSRLEKLIDEYLARIDSDPDFQWVGKKKQPDNRFVIKNSGKIIFINPAHLIWIEADGYYVNLHTEEKSYLIRNSMAQMQKVLPSHLFMRVHNSSIINIKYIDEIEPYFNGEYFIKLSTGKSVKVSRSYKDLVKKFIDSKKL